MAGGAAPAATTSVSAVLASAVSTQATGGAAAIHAAAITPGEIQSSGWCYQRKQMEFCQHWLCLS